MHQASFDELEKFRKTYLADRTGLTVLDVGSYRSRPKPGAIRHSYRPIFEKVGHRYVGMDIRPGRNVDIVGYENLPKEPYDVVISGQTMEHVVRPWEWLRNLVPLFKEYICIIAPNMMPEHRYPIDTYRYLPDGMRDLFDYAGIVPVDIYMKGWDTVGIGRH